MTSPKPPINYTNRDFNSIKSALINYAKVYYPNTYKDFNDASFGSMMIDMIAYVGDIMSFYVDYQTNETLMDSAIEEESVIKIAKQLGFKFNNTPNATGQAAFFISVPANDAGSGPDTDLIPILKAGTLLSSDSGVAYTLADDVDFANANAVVKVSEVDSSGTPTKFAYKAFGTIVSGELVEETVEVGAFERFLKIKLDGENISEVISVIDSDGNEYFEVDYLSQNTVFRSIRNIGDDSETVPYIVRNMYVPRRFVVDHNLENETHIQFGFGSETEIENKSFPDPTAAALQMNGKQFFSDSTFDPSQILKTEKMGVVPINTTLTVVYRKNTISTVNAAVSAVNTVVDAIVEFRKSSIAKSTALQQISAFEVDNEEPIVGNVSLPTADEIKVRAIDNYAAQNRAVTKQDYLAIIYRMPAKFGGIQRANIVQDTNSAKRNLNLYVVAEDSDNNLTNASTTLKENVKVWLNRYKMINDTIDILDANIVNIGINFEIIGELDKDFTLILNDALEQLKENYQTKFNLGEPFYISDVFTLLNDVDGVVDTKSVEIVRKSGTGYSASQFDISSNTTSDGRLINVPDNIILEIKDFDADIVGVIR
jgi:hypothetical protein|tara:strand:- start:14210 stop:16000 length:1791 start_codon:yes stop_codon:yes gene_type:complete